MQHSVRKTLNVYKEAIANLMLQFKFQNYLKLTVTFPRILADSKAIFFTVEDGESCHLRQWFSTFGTPPPPLKKEQYTI